MKYPLMVFGLISCICTASAVPATAAEFKSNSDCILLTGPIVPGDFQQIRSRFPYENDRRNALCLNSSGGNYLEAVQIAKYLYDTGIPTLIRSGDTCMSACAIIFMGGSLRADDTVISYRALHVRGTLGFHAPYITVPEGQYNQQNVQVAYRLALNAISELAKIAPLIDFDYSLLAEMLAKGPQEIYSIDLVGDATRHRITLLGAQSAVPQTDDDFIRACDNVFTITFNARHAIQSHFNLKEYTQPMVTRAIENGQLTVRVGAYPPEATRTCVIQTSDSTWASAQMFFTEPTDSPLMKITYAPEFFLAPQTPIRSLPLAK